MKIVTTKTSLFIAVILASIMLIETAQAQRAAQTVQGLYDEPKRPQFHFTPKINWMNDPNGLVYYDGEYHMFFQHNPEGINWGNMTWGHAISPDLIHWEQQSHKIWPDSLGTIFSGSAVVDHNNTAGFQTGDEKTIVAAFTYAGSRAEPSQPFTQALAYSNDRGRTFTKYEGNPVLENQTGGGDRDPKLFWHEPTEKWVMVLYLGRGHRFAVYTSPNLKEWTETQILEDEFYEVPDLFELPVDGDPNNTKWVFLDVFGDYLLGDFDGERFERTSGRHKTDYGNNFYATQTWDNVPDDRMIQIAWMRGGNFEGMPFNQQMSFPAELSLRTTDKGVRLFRNPIKEIENLYKETHSMQNVPLALGDNPLEGIEGDLFDVKMTINPGDASVIGLGIGGAFPRYNTAVEYYTSDQTIRSLTYPPGMQNLTYSTAPLAPVNGMIELRILIDRTSIEIFGNEGQMSITNHYERTGDARNIGLFLYAREGEANIQSIDVNELNSAWKHERGSSN